MPLSDYLPKNTTAIGDQERRNLSSKIFRENEMRSYDPNSYVSDSSLLSDLGKSFTAGVGDIGRNVGQGMRWVGGKIGSQYLTETGQQIEDIGYAKNREIEKTINPNHGMLGNLAVGGARMLPTMAVVAPVAAAGGIAAGAAGATAGVAALVDGGIANIAMSMGMAANTADNLSREIKAAPIEKLAETNKELWDKSLLESNNDPIAAKHAFAEQISDNLFYKDAATSALLGAVVPWGLSKTISRLTVAGKGPAAAKVLKDFLENPETKANVEKFITATREGQAVLKPVAQGAEEISDTGLQAARGAIEQAMPVAQDIQRVAREAVEANKPINFLRAGGEEVGKSAITGASMMGASQAFQNQALQESLEPNRGTFQDVLQAAGQGALMGAGFGLHPWASRYIGEKAKQIPFEDIQKRFATQEAIGQKTIGDIAETQELRKMYRDEAKSDLLNVLKNKEQSDLETKQLQEMYANEAVQKQEPPIAVENKVTEPIEIKQETPTNRVALSDAQKALLQEEYKNKKIAEFNEEEQKISDSFPKYEFPKLDILAKYSLTQEKVTPSTASHNFIDKNKDLYDFAKSEGRDIIVAKNINDEALPVNIRNALKRGLPENAERYSARSAQIGDTTVLFSDTLRDHLDARAAIYHEEFHNKWSKLTGDEQKNHIDFATNYSGILKSPEFRKAIAERVVGQNEKINYDQAKTLFDGMDSATKYKTIEETFTQMREKQMDPRFKAKIQRFWQALMERVGIRPSTKEIKRIIEQVVSKPYQGDTAKLSATRELTEPQHLELRNTVTNAIKLAKAGMTKEAAEQYRQAAIMARGSAKFDEFVKELDAMTNDLTAPNISLVKKANIAKEIVKTLESKKEVTKEVEPAVSYSLSLKKEKGISFVEDEKQRYFKPTSFIERIPSKLKEMQRTASPYVRSIADIVGKKSVALKNKIVESTFKHGKRVRDDLEELKPLMHTLKKMPNERQLEFNIWASGGDREKMLKYLEANGVDRIAAEKMIKDTRVVLDRIIERAAAVGMDVGYIKEYFPRIVKDLPGLRRAIGEIKVREENAKREQLGKPKLTEEESVKIIKDQADTIQNALKQEMTKLSTDHLSALEESMVIQKLLGPTFSGSSTKNTKQRMIEQIPPELAKYYAKPVDALLQYVENMNSAISKREMWGLFNPESKEAYKAARQLRRWAKDTDNLLEDLTHDPNQRNIRLAHEMLGPKYDKNNNIENLKTALVEKLGRHNQDLVDMEQRGLLNDETSIAAIINKLSKEGLIDPEDIPNMKEALGAVYYKGKKDFTDFIRTSVYGATMGQLKSAIRQLPDILYSVHENGWTPTLQALSINLRKLLNKELKEKYKDISSEALGIVNQASFELGDVGFLAKAVEKAFKYSGVTYADVLGKDVLGVASLIKIRNDFIKMKDMLAKDAPRSRANFNLQMEKLFAENPESQARFKKELEANKFGEMSQEYIYKKLAQYYPISRATAMSKQVTGGALTKMAYQFKNYPLKYMNMVYEQTHDRIKLGHEWIGKAQEMKKSSDAKIREQGLELEKDGAILVTEGWIKLVRIPLMTVGANLTATFAINSMLQRKEEKSDSLLENYGGRVLGELVNLVGANRVIMNDLRGGDWSKVFANMVAPVAGIAGNIVRDINKTIKKVKEDEPLDIQDYNFLAYIPLAGSWLYSYIGKGRKKSLEAEEKNAENNY